MENEFNQTQPELTLDTNTAETAKKDETDTVIPATEGMAKPQETPAVATSPVASPSTAPIEPAAAAPAPTPIEKPAEQTQPQAPVKNWPEYAGQYPLGNQQQAAQPVSPAYGQPAAASTVQHTYPAAAATHTPHAAHTAPPAQPHAGGYGAGYTQPSQPPQQPPAYQPPTYTAQSPAANYQQNNHTAQGTHPQAGQPAGYQQAGTPQYTYNYQQNQQGYGYTPPYYGYQQEVPGKQKAVISLILGISGFLINWLMITSPIGIILGIIGIIMANSAKKLMPPDKNGMAIGGLIMSIVSLVFGLMIFLLLFIGIIAGIAESTM